MYAPVRLPVTHVRTPARVLLVKGRLGYQRSVIAACAACGAVLGAFMLCCVLGVLCAFNAWLHCFNVLVYAHSLSRHFVPPSFVRCVCWCVRVGALLLSFRADSASIFCFYLFSLTLLVFPALSLSLSLSLLLYLSVLNTTLLCHSASGSDRSDRHSLFALSRFALIGRAYTLIYVSVILFHILSIYIIAI